MKKYKNKYRIESHRHRYWDYSLPGGYFITICTAQRACFLGNISDGVMQLSSYGQVVQDEMLRIPAYHDSVQLGAWVVMPNHVHMIVDIIDGDNNDDDDGNGNDVEKIHEFSLPQPPPQPKPQPQSEPQSPPWWHDPNYRPTTDEIKQYRKQRRKMTIPKIVGKFKMITSKQINIIRQSPHQKNWQSNYHDHIIKNHTSYQRIQTYIKNNPLHWDKDKFHG